MRSYCRKGKRPTTSLGANRKSRTAPGGQSDWSSSGERPISVEPALGVWCEEGWSENNCGSGWDSEGRRLLVSSQEEFPSLIISRSLATCTHQSNLSIKGGHSWKAGWSLSWNQCENRVEIRHGRKGVFERARSMDWTAQWMQTALRKPSQESLWEGMYVQYSTNLEFRCLSGFTALTLAAEVTYKMAEF